MLKDNFCLLSFRIWGNPAISGQQRVPEVCQRLGVALSSRQDITSCDVLAYEVDGATYFAYGE